MKMNVSKILVLCFAACAVSVRCMDKDEKSEQPTQSPTIALGVHMATFGLTRSLEGQEGLLNELEKEAGKWINIYRKNEILKFVGTERARIERQKTEFSNGITIQQAAGEALEGLNFLRRYEQFE